MTFLNPTAPDRGCAARSWLTVTFQRRDIETKIAWLSAVGDTVWGDDEHHAVGAVASTSQRSVAYTCTDNNRDVDHLQPNQPNLSFKYEPEASSR